MNVSSLEILESPGFEDYSLLDVGEGRKLERFGPIVVNRPEPQALWYKRLSEDDWNKAHASFSPTSEFDEKGRWRIDKSLIDPWSVRINLPSFTPNKNIEIFMHCRLQGLWHVGIFPEQFPHWVWMLEQLNRVTQKPPKVLNLFGYTGAASLIAAALGAEVTHVDASKKALAWAKENQKASHLENAKIRWILDDASAFVSRELRRGRAYHFILLDPPKFGRGPEGQIWDLFQDISSLLQKCRALLCKEKSAMILTVYAIRASVVSFDQLVREVIGQKEGVFQSGELTLRSTTGRLLPTSLFTKWTSMT